MTKGVYSEFEVREQHIKVTGDESFSDMNCVGTSEEELEVKVVTKNCRGVKAKEKVRGTGNGTLKESLHVPRAIYNKIYDMSRDTLASGVYAYGQKSVHPEFCLTQRVFDEDDVEKLKAYPRCIIESGPKRPISNGATEVAELELEITLLPDDDGECMYECLADEVSSDIKTAWLTAFTRTLVQAVGSTPSQGDTSGETSGDTSGVTDGQSS